MGAFAAALENCYGNPFVTTEAVQSAIQPAMESDPDGVAEFIEANEPGQEDTGRRGTIVNGEGKDGDTGLNDSYMKNGQVMDRRGLYFMMRLGGMGYGPGFRMIRFATGKSKQWTKTATNMECHSLGTLMLKGDHDDWENYVGYHPGYFDTALQVQSARGAGLRSWFDSIQQLRPAPGKYKLPTNSPHTSTHYFSGVNTA